jgi:hypothetical protein
MNRNDAIPTATTTLAELMAMGARVEFGSGRAMRGDVRNGYVDVSNEFGPLGVWDADAADGVDRAVGDLVRDAREHGVDLHGRTIADPAE